MKKIGLFGLVINNGNMGCVALTYSSIVLLEKVSGRLGEVFEYFVFEYNPDQTKTEMLCSKIGIKVDQIHSCKIQYNFRNIKNIKKCDLIFDLTEGDSFSDIYGSKRFIKTFLQKEMAIIGKVPLILGPQTYGPFFKKINRFLAGHIIKKSIAVFTRDSLSKNIVYDHYGILPITCTDVAFALPYKVDRPGVLPKSRKCVGVNMSKLLYNEEYDHSRVMISGDFKKFTNLLLQKLCERYTILLISHVNGDYIINNDIHKRYPQSILLNKFDDPIQAKSIISSLDAIISCRMHACIAGFSSGINTIPLAYSRKFKGLFTDLGLNSIIDLQEKIDVSSIDKIIDIIENDINVINQGSIDIIEQKMNLLTDSLYTYIKLMLK